MRISDWSSDVCSSDLFGRAGAVLGRHRSGSAGEDDALGLHSLERLQRAAERGDFAVDARLPHPPGDELRHLASEINDEDGIAGLDGHGGAISSTARPVKRHRPEGGRVGKGRASEYRLRWGPEYY